VADLEDASCEACEHELDGVSLMFWVKIESSYRSEDDSPIIPSDRLDDETPDIEAKKDSEPTNCNEDGRDRYHGDSPIIQTRSHGVCEMSDRRSKRERDRKERQTSGLGLPNHCRQ